YIYIKTSIFKNCVLGNSYLLRQLTKTTTLMFSKIKITLVACILFVAGGMMMSSVNQLQASSTCPNGCVRGYTGCYCHSFYWFLSEYNWDDEEIQ
ncbi:hypothetical protein, partial [Mongoliitalea lutea]|uniref:hypothetical protein n=1 Tax=Mongoliitalea lutea TaxID=849756 RepID=UPI001E604B5A